nr:carbamoyl-phosphate synthase large subunit [Desulfobacterales bacterium]
MPKRTDIRKILVVGSGPIIISQACEFDYSGTQACKALKEEGYEIILVNSNPATIMTDPEMADRTYIEPVIPEIVAKIIEKERPDACLPTLGGQTGLNVAISVDSMGVFERFGVEVIGASPDVIRKAEDRDLFRESMTRIGLRVPRSGIAKDLEESLKIAQEIGYPIIVRPSFTLGGTGGGVAYNVDELRELAASGLEMSLIHQIMLEESVLGWKEYELEVMRDYKDNVIIICPIENFDSMGVHTGDSITVAPAQTLTDREYQTLRDASIAIMREIGVDTGGCNIQFAINPRDGEMVVIEMNPRVSRSSALASKATGFPIAKIAAKLAVGYSLDEIPNDITRETLASFEPSIDYCVVKIPRWDFEKFPGTEDLLTTSMKSVGEVMAIGRTFKEALGKGICSLEIGRYGLLDGIDPELKVEDIGEKLVKPNSKRLFYLAAAIREGMEISELNRITGIDPWFLTQIEQMVDLEKELRSFKEFDIIDPDLLRQAKEWGFSDLYIAKIYGTDEDTVRRKRELHKISATFKLVDTCAAEFEAYTPYYYSTYETEDEVRSSQRKKVMILGGGPNRIGQGIEFDYCCVHASMAARSEGLESIMVNSNPETVSTDYDTSDKLYFEPLTRETVLNIVEKERPKGIMVQFGGQTPLNLAVPLEQAGIPILGTSPDSIDRAEDRERFKVLLNKLNLTQPRNGTAFTVDQALNVADEIGFPVVVRPSYVLGGRAMEIVYDQESLKEFMEKAALISPEHPVLIDQFLEEAIEVDVDAVCDGKRTVLCGIMEHIEQAGIHSGDSACVIPPYSLDEEIQKRIKEHTKALALELQVRGLMNIQYAVKDEQIFVLEVNPRASRTVPFVSKATGTPWAKIATHIMLGKTLEEIGITEEVSLSHVAIKESVFPFVRFPGVDTLLGPEMKSTGEVMGIDLTFGAAFAKAQLGAGQMLPHDGNIFISVKDQDKKDILPLANRLLDLGFKILATKGTSRFLTAYGIENEEVKKVREGRPHIVDRMKNNEVALVINTTFGSRSVADSFSIRRTALEYNIPYTTTISGARATVSAIEAIKKESISILAIQDYYHRIKK